MTKYSFVAEVAFKYSYQHLFFIICIYYLWFLSLIFNHQQKYFLELDHWTCWLAHLSISEIMFVGKCPWLVYFDLSYILFDTFLSDRGIFLTWLLFSNSNVLAVLIPWYSSPSLDWVLKFSLNLGTVLHLEIDKQCLLQNNIFGQYDH